MKDVLTIKEAYAAMYEYLKGLYALTPSDELGGLLGSMSLLDDGTPADPAVWADWLLAVQKARQGAVDMRLKLNSE
ncbi:hypothetical protein D7V80_05530 [Corallococcus sp. CA054B]|nr:hypothetical protein D7V80_05530 [Corallococcus sp. CA054B]